MNSPRRTLRRTLARLLVVVSSLLPFIGGVVLGQAAENDADKRYAKALDLATAAYAKKQIKIIASDKMEGRESGYPGNNRAANHIRKEFKRAGLKSLANDGSYFQPWLIRTTQPDLAKSSIQWRRGRKKGRFGTGRTRRDQEFAVFSFSGSGKATGPVVFAGYGITAPEHKYDDYAQIDAKGKIVLVLRHEPRENDSSGWDGAEPTPHSEFESKYRNAMAHGAKAILLVTDPLNHRNDRRRPNPPRAGRPMPVPDDRKDRRAAKGIPAVWLDYEAAAKLVGGSRVIENWQRKIDKSLRPASQVIPKLTATVTVKNGKKDLATQNVCAVWPGTDAKLKDEFVVIGAHYDHVGTKDSGRDKIFNGADDNGSGTTALLTAAQALARSGLKPRRSIAFLAFSGEELGLLGAKLYAEHPLRPLDKTVAMINMDMVGRNFDRGCEVIGTQFSPDLRRLVQREGKRLKMKLEFKTGNAQNIIRRSDQWAFLERGVPAAFLTTGQHKDYHQVSDHWDLIKTKNVAAVSRLALSVMLHLADADGRPRYVEP